MKTLEAWQLLKGDKVFVVGQPFLWHVERITFYHATLTHQGPPTRSKCVALEDKGPKFQLVRPSAKTEGMTFREAQALANAAYDAMKQAADGPTAAEAYKAVMQCWWDVRTTERNRQDTRPVGQRTDVLAYYRHTGRL